MQAVRETHAFDWHGIAVSVEARPDYLGMGVWHLEIRSVDGRPNPISETGYRSHFLSGSIVEEWGGVEPYVTAWLNAEAEKPAWKAAEQKRQQLTLF